MTESERIEPPAEHLTKPDGLESLSNEWVVVARNRRVNKDWETLLTQYPENTKRCYEYLRQTPTRRWQGRIFPLRGKKYKGAWEYELTSAARIFYVPDEKKKKVVVYYAGPHPRKSPYPPSS